VSTAANTGGAESAAVADAIEPYRRRFDEDAKNFSLALLALAKSNAKQVRAFNQTSPQDKAALRTLARWRREAQHALHHVRAIPAGAPGRSLAERWLKALIAALDLQVQALSLLDPTKAAEAANSAGPRIEEYQRLEARLDQVLA
jgi:hypothetical protein